MSRPRIARRIQRTGTDLESGGSIQVFEHGRHVGTVPLRELCVYLQDPELRNVIRGRVGLSRVRVPVKSGDRERTRGRNSHA